MHTNFYDKPFSTTFFHFSASSLALWRRIRSLTTSSSSGVGFCSDFGDIRSIMCIQYSVPCSAATSSLSSISAAKHAVKNGKDAVSTFMFHCPPFPTEYRCSFTSLLLPLFNLFNLVIIVDWIDICRMDIISFRFDMTGAPSFVDGSVYIGHRFA